MVRIMGDRAVGKTASLLFEAMELAKKNPDETIYFVGYHAPKDLRIIGIFEIPDNIKFITPREFLSRNYRSLDYVIIDEVESLLKLLGVKAYSLTLSDRVAGNVED